MTIERICSASLPKLPIETKRVEKQSRGDTEIVNSLARAAFMDDCEYLYHTDDRSDFLTKWTVGTAGALTTVARSGLL